VSNKTVKILAVGDLFLGEHPFTLGHGVTSVTKEKGADFLFSRIKAHLKASDIVCGNLEGIISPKNKTEKGIKSAIFWGDPECAEAMKDAGFNCVFLANNHTAQHGIDALKRTCTLLDKHKIKWTGFNSSKPETPIPAIFNVRGIRVGFLSYCDTQQYHLDTIILPLIDIDNIKHDVSKLKKECDIVVISLHWGDEFIEYPSPKQVQIAHEIIDAGVHLILGHHSHTMQGIERYKHGLIAYSLGTFIKDLWRKELRESVILSCELTKEGVKQIDIVPVIINESYQPELHAGQDCHKFLKRLDALSEKIYSNNSRDPGELQQVYLREIKKLERTDKLDNIKHYMKNIFRYDKKLLIENIILILKRRIYKKNI